MADFGENKDRRQSDGSSSPEPPVAGELSLMGPTPVVADETLPLDNIPGKDEKDRMENLYVVVSGEYKSEFEGVSPDGQLSKFRTEYDKMFKAFVRSRDHINRLFDQYGMLYGEAVSNLSFNSEAMKSSVVDQQTLRNLKAQIKKASDILETSSKREEALKEETRSLKADINSLQQTMKQGVGLSAVQERTVNELIQAKETAQKELENEMEKIVTVRNDFTELSDKIKRQDSTKRDLERDIYESKERNAQKKSEIDSEVRGKDKLERDLRELRAMVAVKTSDVRSRQDAVDRLNAEINSLDIQIKSQKTNMEKLQKDRELLEARAAKLKEDCSAQIKQKNQLLEQNEAIAKEFRMKESEYTKTRQEVKKCNKVKDHLHKKNNELEEQKAEAEQERRVLRSENEQLQSKITGNKKSIEHDRKMIDDLKREKEILLQNLSKTQDTAGRHANLSLLMKQSRHNLEIEFERYTRECTSMLKKIKELQEHKDGYVSNASKLQSLCIQTLQEIKQSEARIFDYKKMVVQADTKLKHQQNLYEAVQSDRNLHSKQLLESQNEVMEMKQKLKVMNFQINGYKEDILSKDEGLKREIGENDKLHKDIDIITDEIKTLKHQNELAQAYVRCQLAEEVKLNQFVKEADLERTRQENALQVLLGERENLSSQLIRQNDALSKVYNKLKTNRFSLLRSEKHYADRLRSIGTLRREIRELKQEKIGLNGDTTDVTGLRNRVARLSDELTTEKTRLKALDEELKFPVNVHRWRKLEGSNPKTFELVQLMHTLQKKLIEKTSEDAEKARLIAQTEELYIQLKNLLAKQTGPESIEQVHEFERVLKEKGMQLKHMNTEMNMYRAKVCEYRYQIDVLDKSFDNMRKRYAASSLWQEGFVAYMDCVDIKGYGRHEGERKPMLLNSHRLTWYRPRLRLRPTHRSRLPRGRPFLPSDCSEFKLFVGILHNSNIISLVSKFSVRKFPTF